MLESIPGLTTNLESVSATESELAPEMESELTLCEYQYVASLDLNAYSYGDAENDSDFDSGPDFETNSASRADSEFR